MEELLPGLAAVADVHPLLVHFPIAFWSGALLFWTAGLVGRKDFRTAGRWLIYLGAVSALATAATGLSAGDRIGHDTPGHEFVHVHRNLMLAATALGVLTAVLASIDRPRSPTWLRGAVLAGLASTTAVCFLGADRGALLVYGHGLGMRAEARSASPKAVGEGEGAAPTGNAAAHGGGHDHGSHPH